MLKSFYKWSGEKISQCKNDNKLMFSRSIRMRSSLSLNSLREIRWCQCNINNRRRIMKKCWTGNKSHRHNKPTTLGITIGQTSFRHPLATNPPNSHPLPNLPKSPPPAPALNNNLKHNNKFGTNSFYSSKFHSYRKSAQLWRPRMKSY